MKTILCRSKVSDSLIRKDHEKVSVGTSHVTRVTVGQFARNFQTY